jgi:superfamily I DNA/RNA helicase
MGTFHSIFLRILHVEAGHIGFTSQFTIYDTADSKSLIRSIIKEMGLDEKVYKPGMVQARISNAKNHLVSPAGYANNKEAYEGDRAAKVPALRDIYQRYWERCRQADAMDFDDLLFYTFLLFRDHPEVLARYQDQFRYILVDEYQDTNFAQHSIVLQLAKNHQHVCVVGDDAQSIYSFRGAGTAGMCRTANRRSPSHPPAGNAPNISGRCREAPEPWLHGLLRKPPCCWHSLPEKPDDSWHSRYAPAPSPACTLSHPAPFP